MIKSLFPSAFPHDFIVLLYHMAFVKVVFPEKWSQGYTYEGEYQRGSIVSVPLKARIVTGVVTGSAEKIEGARKVLDVMFHAFSHAFCDFLEKASEYNMLFLGEVLHLCLRKWSDKSPWYLRDGQIRSISTEKRTKLPSCELFYNINIPLNQEQKICLSQMHFDKPVLLKGATGSGKTNVYFAAVAKFIDKQCLIMLPEVALTEEFTHRVYEAFGFWPHIWHHKVSDMAKDVIWSWALSGKPGIILGSRSALWLPFGNLGCMVIDEEHDSSYKQENAPRYNCRDMAVLRGSIERAAVILVSATPSLESWHNVQRGKYALVELVSDIKHSAMIVKRRFGEWLSTEAKYEMISALNSGGQVLLFLNRRGFASNLFCTACGDVLLCKNCSASLIIYKNKSAKCSYCGYTSTIAACKNCKANTWQMYGIGIEKVRDSLQELFPNASIAMLSSDSLDISDQVNLIHENKVQIIIATQILSKGHHFANLKLIIILQADHGLASGDPRNTEKVYQLLTQVKGRFGTNDKKNLTIIQSIQPDQRVIQAIAANDFEDWVDAELEMRRKYDLPPFAGLIRIIVGAKVFEHSYADAQHIYDNISKVIGIKIYGPAPTRLYQYKGQMRSYLLIHYKNSYPQRQLRNILLHMKLPHKSNVVVDVDPRSFF